MEEEWTPPGRDCGACGHGTCNEFLLALKAGTRKKEECSFSSQLFCQERPGTKRSDETVDILGDSYDFILHPLPGECSARKILLPFRPDLVERWDIHTGDIITGRPMGSGCPVQHVLRVLSASKVSGVIITHVVGPLFSRGREVKDLQAYHIIGFEGIADVINHSPVFGRRMRFLPAYCMMNLTHTGVVNQLLTRREGLQVKVEDIRIL